MASKIRQSTFRAFVAHNLIGDSMLVRLRSTTIGLLGLIAAVGLGLIVVISQLGWPGVFSGPLPQAPPVFVQNDSIAMPATATQPTHRASRPIPTQAKSAPSRPAPAVPQEVEPVPEPPVAVEQPQATGHGHHGHASQPQPAPSPTVVAQVPSDEPVAEGSTAPPETEPASESPGHSGEAPGHSGDQHGHSGESHGHSTAAPSQPSASPGHSGEAPGHSSEGPPGHSGESHGSQH